MFPSTAQKSGTNDAFNLCFEDFLLSQPPFSADFETFRSLDPRRECRLSTPQYNKIITQGKKNEEHKESFYNR